MQPQPCPTCGALVVERDRHRRAHVRTDELAERVDALECLVRRHHSVEGPAEVDFTERARTDSQ